MMECEALKDPEQEGFERCGQRATWMMRRIGPICWYHKRQFEQLQIDVDAYDPLEPEPAPVIEENGK